MESNIQLIDADLLCCLHKKACESVKKRIPYDLRTTPNDNSQRMLNVLEPGTQVPIHRHIDTSESIVCLEGRIDWIFYEPIQFIESDCLTMDDTSAQYFREISRFCICPQNMVFGIQVPKKMWHSIYVYEPSVIIEAKDGAYQL